MPITAFHDTLDDETRDGWPPDATPVFGPALASYLDLTREPRPAKTREYVRPSDALSCARKLSYIYGGYPTEDVEPSGLWNFTLGDKIHELAQAAAFAAFPDAVCEVDLNDTVTVDGVDIPVNCFVDVHVPSLSLVSDFKSVGGFAYKMMIGERGRPEGPKREHLIQAGIGAMLLDAENVSVTYFAKEALSVAIAARKGFTELERFTAEWTVPLADIRDEVEAELARMWAINRLYHEDGLLAARKVPGVPGEITDPERGAWVQRDTDDRVVSTGNYWGCAYCPFQMVCAEHGPGRVKE